MATAFHNSLMPNDVSDYPTRTTLRRRPGMHSTPAAVSLFTSCSSPLSFLPKYDFCTWARPNLSSLGFTAASLSPTSLLDSADPPCFVFYALPVCVSLGPGTGVYHGETTDRNGAYEMSTHVHVSGDTWLAPGGGSCCSPTHVGPSLIRNEQRLHVLKNSGLVMLSQVLSSFRTPPCPD
ncbi:hypothetical protein OH76DRAFT_177398 [Lentinus brumalis]|uniref:Uncharacterized protein n=1 Tax=Lentinus brumalis TaxID=2498619 RepID=A0A371CNS7_9APHY|nr:hypothetical protein OH76DRAFT_177398 [Polyporus brumalis]